MSKPAGSRVRSIHILCTQCRVPQYEPVEDTSVYTVVVPQYLVSGGDGYTLIRDEMVKHNSGEVLGPWVWVLGLGSWVLGSMSWLLGSWVSGCGSRFLGPRFSGLGPGWEDLHLFVSICRRPGHFRGVPLYQPTQAGFSSRGRPDQCLRLRLWT